MTREPACGYSLWISHDYRTWYPMHKMLTLAEAEREAGRLRRQGALVEVRVNTSLVW